jgi:LysM repeat protein
MRTDDRSPARWLAPAALMVCALAVFIVVSTSGSSGGSSDTTSVEQPRSGSSSSSKRSTSKKKDAGGRTYTVKPGDTLGGIAEKTGVPLSELQALNPDLDAQALQTGEKVKLGP